MAESLVDWMRTRGLRRSVRAGATLAKRGTQVESVLLVERGRVFLERWEANGKLLPISVCGKGAFVGLSAAILERPYDVSATSRIDGEVVAVAASLVRELTTSSMHAPLVAKALAAEARVLADQCASLQSQTVRDRVLSVLAELTDGVRTFPVDVVLPMQDLAAMVGADLAQICRVMRHLRTEGVIDYGKRRLAVCRSIGALRVADDPW
ncbi:MAG TPA: Crp/Fnr family transcriptional regulator [Jiangellaceae bacterium]|nr:Crp/Fnr family transcriptional regulator [Jiangellaceae bacterium]